MKVLLLCSLFQPEIAKCFNLKPSNAGGWISGIINGIKKYSDINLSYAVFMKNNHKNIQHQKINEIDYYLVEYAKKEDLDQFFSSASFDIYHLFGTENEFCIDVFEYLPLNKTLVYIQGIANECFYHYEANLSAYYKENFMHKIYFKMNLQDMKKRAEREMLIMEKAHFFCGRTEWDKSFLYKIQNTGKYYHLNETLRDDFYCSAKWDVNKMNPHTIFVTQASYPLKGAHLIVEIINILKNEYPDIHCYIGGTNLMKSQGLATKLHFSYASIIQNMIKKYNLENNVIFVGNKTSKEIVDYMQNSNVFLLASSIENSPNSLQEAMLIGTPCVASYVGGVDSLVTSKDQAILYPYDDPTRAAYEISNIFKDTSYAQHLSVNAIARAEELTNKEENAKTLYDIYKDMCSC